MIEAVLLDRWKVRYDPEATRRAYAEIEKGGADECVCLYCKNFAAAREEVFPPEVLELFESLGIDYRKDTEIWEASPRGARVRFYSGWYNFVGDVDYVGNPLPAVRLVGTNININLDCALVAPHIALSFGSCSDMAHRAFAGQQIASLDFYAEVPWVLDEMPD